RSGEVRPPAAFMFAPDFDEDLPGAGVPYLADGLAAGGFTVLVHSFFTERGDRFDPRVITTSAPLTLSELLATLDRAAPDGTAGPGLGPGPPPEPWILPAEVPGGGVPGGGVPGDKLVAGPPAEPTTAEPGEPSAEPTAGSPATVPPGGEGTVPVLPAGQEP